MAKRKENDETKYLIIPGTIKKCGYYSEIFGGRKKDPMYHINLEIDNENAEVREAIDTIREFVYANKTEFIPKWVKENDYPNYLNLKTKYDISIKTPAGDKTSFDKLDMDHNEINPGASCLVKIKCNKNDTIYPHKLKLNTWGTPYDEFEGM